MKYFTIFSTFIYIVSLILLVRFWNSDLKSEIYKKMRMIPTIEQENKQLKKRLDNLERDFNDFKNNQKNEGL